MDGPITVEALGGALTIDAGDGTFTLTDSHMKTYIDSTDEFGTVASSSETAIADTARITDYKRGQGLGHPGKLFVFQGAKNCYRKSRDRQKEEIIIPIIEIEGAADIAEGVTLGGNRYS